MWNEGKRGGRATQSLGSWKADFRNILSSSRKYFYAGPDRLLLILAHQNIALTSHVRVCVTGVTSQLFSIVQGFGPNKPCIF